MFTLTRKLYEEYWKRNQVSDFTFVAPLTRLKQKSFKTFNATLSLYITLTHSLMWRERERKGEYFLLSGGIKIKRNRVWKGYREQTKAFYWMDWLEINKKLRQFIDQRDICLLKTKRWRKERKWNKRKEKERRNCSTSKRTLDGASNVRAMRYYLVHDSATHSFSISFTHSFTFSLSQANTLLSQTHTSNSPLSQPHPYANSLGLTHIS